MDILRLSHNVKRNMTQYDYSSKTPQHEGDSESDDVHLKGDVELDFADEKVEIQATQAKIVEEPTQSKVVEEKKISSKYFHPAEPDDSPGISLSLIHI